MDLGVSRRGPGLGTIPRGLLGALVLVAMVEAALCRYEVDFRKCESWEWVLSGKAARRQARGSEILFFGTSMIKVGVVPRVVKERTGRRAYNLALCAGPPAACYFLLRRAIESGARPSIVVLDCHPHGLAEPPRFFARYWPHLASFRECLDLGWNSRDAGFFATIALGRLFPSVRDRDEIRFNIQAAFQGLSASLAMRSETMALCRNMARNRGAQVLAKNPEYRGEVASPYERWLLPETWKCLPVNEAYLSRFLDLAASRGITVCWVVPPFAPDLQQRRERKGLDQFYTRFMRSVLDRFPNLVIVDGRHSGYGHQVFVDAIHLDRQGALAFSTGLGEAIHELSNLGRGGPRWVDLPAYRERPIDPSLEDRGQSRIAVQRLFQAGFLR